MVVLSPVAERLRDALRKDSEILAEFDDDTLQYLANSLEGTDDDEEVLEAWIPTFCAHNGHLEEDTARHVCIRILPRLASTSSDGCSTTASVNDVGYVNRNSSERAVPSAPAKSAEASAANEVPGLREWLRGLSLEQYYDRALEWCDEFGAAHLNEVQEEWEDFAQSLPLKNLERKRLERAMKSVPVSPVSPESTQTSKPEVEEGSPQEPVEDESPMKEKVPEMCKFGGNLSKAYCYDPMELGRGVSATVHRCVSFGEVEGNSEEKKEYAVKIINLKRLGFTQEKEKVQQQMAREIQILMRLRHDNVVALYDVVTEDNKIHLVMDLVEGGDLMKYIIPHKGMPELEARYVFIQLVCALQYIHNKNVVHRDLKPENILVDKKASKITPSRRLLTVKITDFGLSKNYDDGYSFAHTQCGTRAYWAPEVADSANKGGYGPGVDLWSLGVTLYVMLEGIILGNENMKAELDFNEDTSDGRCPISGSARDLIRKLATLNPKERISLEECVNHPWPNKKGVLQRVAQHALNDFQEVVEERFPVPGESCYGHKQLRSELAEFSQTNACSAEARRGEQHEVVVTWSRTVTEAQLQESQKALSSLLERHFPRDGVQAGKTTPNSPSREDSLPTRSFTTSSPSYKLQQSFRLEKRYLRVHEDYGAGLDLIAEEMKGMLVQEIQDCPGQPGLQRGDIINKIAKVSLILKSSDEISKVFGQYFRDGVEIQIKREKK
jgi:serine/threonine protein kinase